MSIKINLNKFDLSSISGLMIDIDDTLYSYSKPNDFAIKTCFEHLKKANLIQSIKLKEFKTLYVKKRKLITKMLNPQGVCRSRQFAFDSLFRDLDISQAYLKANKYEKIYWDAFLQVMEASKEMSDFIKKAKKHGLIICAVTDMQASFQIAKLKKLGLSRYFDYLASSEEAGAEKPNHKIFKLALEKMQLTKSQVVMIGDNKIKDIQGAKSFGIKTIHFKA